MTRRYGQPNLASSTEWACNWNGSEGSNPSYIVGSSPCYDIGPCRSKPHLVGFPFPSDKCFLDPRLPLWIASFSMRSWTCKVALMTLDSLVKTTEGCAWLMNLQFQSLSFARHGSFFLASPWFGHFHLRLSLSQFDLAPKKPSITSLGSHPSVQDGASD